MYDLCIAGDYVRSFFNYILFKSLGIVYQMNIYSSITHSNFKINSVFYIVYMYLCMRERETERFSGCRVIDGYDFGHRFWNCTQIL